jgi:hypothetical protein
MSDTVFHKIIRGEMPSDKVYEDDKCIVIQTLELLLIMAQKRVRKCFSSIFMYWEVGLKVLTKIHVMNFERGCFL